MTQLVPPVAPAKIDRRLLPADIASRAEQIFATACCVMRTEYLLTSGENDLKSIDFTV